MAFQMKFAVITPALIAGAFSERMRFRGYLVFIGLWSLLVYSPFAHWEWGGGFLGSGGLHAIDFAGGSVVHELAGAAALATAMYLKRRHQLERPHNVPLVLLGAVYRPHRRLAGKSRRRGSRPRSQRARRRRLPASGHGSRRGQRQLGAAPSRQPWGTSSTTRCAMAQRVAAARFDTPILV